MPCPACRHGQRLDLQQEVEDREVVHRKIPDHVNVALKQTEIYPRGVIVENVAQCPAGNDLPHLGHGASIDKRMVHHQDQVSPRGFFDQDCGIG